MNLVIQFHHLLIYRQIIRVLFDRKEYQLISCFFQFRCDHVFFSCHIDCERNQCRRHVNIVKGSGHGIFSTDGWQAETDLCIKRTEQCGKRLAPSLWIFTHSAEILLEGEAYFLVVTTGGHDTGKGFQYGIYRSVVWTPGG